MVRTSSGMLLLLLHSAIANAAIITFEPAPCLGCPSQRSSYEEAGVLFTGSFGHQNMALPGSANNGSAGSVRFPFLSRMTIQLADGRPFSLHDVELGEYNSSFAGIQRQITFTGTREDSTTVQQVFTIDGVIGTGPSDFEQFTFSGFSNLQSVDVSGEMISMDNLNISAVPVPTAFWLFLSGLVGMIAVTGRRS